MALINDGVVTLTPGNPGSESIEALNPAITPVDGIASWPIYNSFTSRKVQVRVYEVATGEEVDMGVRVLQSNPYTITLYWNADSNVPAGTYVAIVMH